MPGPIPLPGLSVIQLTVYRDRRRRIEAVTSIR